MNALLSRGGSASLLTLAALSCASPPSRAEPPKAPPAASAQVTAAPAASASAPPSASPSAAAVPKNPLAERLVAISVRERLADLAKKHDEVTPSPHAVMLEFVAEAIERAEPDMFVRYAAKGGEAFPILEYEITDAGHFPSYPDGEVSTGLLAKYGGTTRLGYVSGQTSYILSYSVDPKPLPDGSPGLVWSVEVEGDEAFVAFVSLDGETYGLGAASIDLDVGSPASWPPPASGPAFGRMAFTVGRRPQTRDLEGPDGAVLKCAERARLRLTQEQITEDPSLEAAIIRKHCKQPIVAWEKAFSGIIDDSVKARTALVTRAKARLQSRH